MDRATRLDGLIQELDEAGDDLCKAVRAAARRNHKVAARLRDEKSLHDAVAGVAAAQNRQALDAALARYVAARHRMRAEVVAIALEDGTSVSEVGRVFGFSRQLAQRYAREGRR